MLSKAYKWDTTKGRRRIYDSCRRSVNHEATARVKVDNTAPVIKTNIEKDKEYKGEFTIEAGIKMH